jgi:hypothetical protein
VKATNIFLVLAYGIDARKINTTITNDKGENIAAEAHITATDMCPYCSEPNKSTLKILHQPSDGVNIDVFNETIEEAKKTKKECVSN